MPCDNRAFIKGVQLAACIVCLAYKIWTIWEAERVFLLLQKQSKEWDWKNYTQPRDVLTLLTDITYGAYVIICFSLLVGHVSGDVKTRGETTLLIIGCCLFFLVGGLLVTFIDEVPEKLLDNTIILGVLSIITGILLLVDAGLGPKAQTQRKAKKLKAVDSRPVKKAEPEKVKVEESVKVEKVEEKKEVVEEKKAPASPVTSVEIRVKENGAEKIPSYQEHGRRVLPPLDVLSQADRVDRLLQSPTITSSNWEPEPPSVGYLMAKQRARAQVGLLQSSPVRHTTSYYIHSPQPAPPPT